jgi:hypothetical protein
VKLPISIAVAIITGLIILSGYFLNLPGLQSARSLLLSWAVILAAFATWVGVVNLLSVHASKIRLHKPDAPYSVLLIIAFVVTLLLVIADSILSPTAAQLNQVVSSIQMPVESSLMAVLTFALAYAVIRLLRRRRDAFAILFLVSVVVFLILNSGVLPSSIVPFSQEILNIANWLPTAGSRGILLGVALGSLATGLRILLGADRPYRG